MSNFKVKESELKACFKAMDADNSGFIDKSEIASALAQLGATDKDQKELADMFMKEDDKNKDGKLSYEEFKAGLFNNLC